MSRNRNRNRHRQPPKPEHLRVVPLEDGGKWKWRRSAEHDDRPGRVYAREEARKGLLQDKKAIEIITRMAEGDSIWNYSTFYKDEYYWHGKENPSGGIFLLGKVVGRLLDAGYAQYDTGPGDEGLYTITASGLKFYEDFIKESATATSAQDSPT